MIKFLQIIVIGFAVIIHLDVAAGRGFPAPNVNVVNAEIRSLSPAAWVSGTVVSRNNSQISAEVSGRLISLAELGEKVSKGDVIAQIDDSTLLIRKRENSASVISAKSRLKFLESEVKRKTTLAKRNLSAATDVDEAISDRDSAKSNLVSAEARLAKTLQDLDYSKVKAPFDGMVTQRQSNLGEYVESGMAIILLVETDNLEASVYAPLTAYKFLKQSAALAIESPLGNDIAPIKAIVPVADARSHLMEVRLDMSAIDWPVGLTIKVAVANGESKEVLSVPRDALVLRREGISVFRINSEGVAEKIEVKVGIGVGEFVQVIGDVEQGDVIVIRGAERLNDGQKVQIKENNDSLVSG